MFKFLFSPLFAVCLIVFGIVLVFAGNRNASKFSALLDHGKTATAEVTRLEWKEKQGSHIDSSYTADVRFRTKDGREITDSVHLEAASGRALRNQHTLTGRDTPTLSIRYLPESPTTFHDAERIDPSAAQAQSTMGRYMLLAGILALILRFFIKRRN
jgi:hypothetical protein